MIQSHSRSYQRLRVPCPLDRATTCVFIVLMLFMFFGGGQSTAQSQDTNFSFSAPTAIQFPNVQYPSDIAVGDLNGNGIDDLVVAGRNNDGIVYVLLSNGDGTFSEPQPLTVATQTDRALLADFNNNGNLDLALALRSFHGRVAVLFGNGDGTFSQEPDYYSVGRLTQSIAAGDLNGSGHKDIVAGNFSSGTVRPMFNNGDGVFTIGDTIIVEDYLAGQLNLSDVSIGDINGNGESDIIATSLGSGRVVVILNNGDGTFAADRSYRLPEVNGTLASGRMTHITDLIGGGGNQIVSTMSILSAPQRFALFFDPVANLFDPPVTFPTTQSSATLWTLELADFDGDGRLDVVAGTAFPPWLAFVKNVSENGTAAFLAPMQLNPHLTFFVRSIAALDVNNNGAQDLAYADFVDHRLLVRINETPQTNVVVDPGNADDLKIQERAGVSGDSSEAVIESSVSSRSSFAEQEAFIASMTVRERLLYFERQGDEPDAPPTGMIATESDEYEKICHEGLHDCFEYADAPGCNNPECCKIVCEFDSFCCTLEWDEFCAIQAEQFGCEPPLPCPAGGSCFDVGEPGDPGCDNETCCKFICSFFDSFCCNSFWDESCVLLAESICDYQFCELPPPRPDELIEPETCGDRINEGCNFFEAEFTPINCGDTYRGSAFAGLPRDTDWYLFEVEDAGQYTWTVTSEFPSQVLVIEGDCDHALRIIERGYGGECSPVSLTFDAEPGTYLLFVSPGTPAGPLRGGVICPPEPDDDDNGDDDGQENEPSQTIFGIEYIAQLSSGLCPDILGDLNGDGVVNVLDLLILLENWGECPDTDDCPADLNGDGEVNVLDLLILLENWG